MQVMGYELRFGKKMREKKNIVCYGAVVLLLVRTVEY
jgi:hypothetical protein